MNVNDGSGGKRLLRVRDGRMAAGVCAGLAAYFKIDAGLVRLAFGIFTVFYGLGILIYLAAWAVLPEEGADSSILESFVHRLLAPTAGRQAGHQDAVP
jgi:phage shock protein C